MLLLCDGARPASVIDLAAGSEVQPSETRCVRQPGGHRLLVAVFDASRQRLLWEHQVGPLSTFGIVGDTIVIVRMGTKRDGRISYDGT